MLKHQRKLNMILECELWILNVSHGDLDKILNHLIFGIDQYLSTINHDILVQKMAMSNLCPNTKWWYPWRLVWFPPTEKMMSLELITQTSSAVVVTYSACFATVLCLCWLSTNWLSYLIEVQENVILYLDPETLICFNCMCLESGHLVSICILLG